MNANDGEEWRSVPGFERLYSVSDLGRVRRELTLTCTQEGRILATPDRGNGYPFVQLCRAGKRHSISVHRLVTAAFIGPCPDGQEVNHINGTKADNRAVNLEYVTSSDNQHHAYGSGLQDARGERNGQAKLTTADVLAIRAASCGRRGEQAALGRQYGVSSTAIRDILAGRTWLELRAA